MIQLPRIHLFIVFIVAGSRFIQAVDDHVHSTVCGPMPNGSIGDGWHLATNSCGFSTTRTSHSRVRQGLQMASESSGRSSATLSILAKTKTNQPEASSISLRWPWSRLRLAVENDQMYVSCIEYRGFWVLAMMSQLSLMGYWSVGLRGWIPATQVADIAMWGKQRPALDYLADNIRRLTSTPIA